ncbi:MAG: helix-turn-helix transcriptional regulator [Elusimicrobiales bacterium]|nr:helix-turn-helix transcriptional regulator [Elusimicrobiales bacterium]
METNEHHPTLEALGGIVGAFGLSMGEFLIPSESEGSSRDASDEDHACLATTDHASGIGENIRRLRKAAGMTQRELATRIGKSFSLIQKYEMGIVIPPITVIRKMADALNVDYFEIIGHTELVPQQPAKNCNAARMASTEDEYAMLQAYRAADERAKKDAIALLLINRKE